MLLFDAVVVVMKICLNTRQKRQPGHMCASTQDSDTLEHHMAPLGSSSDQSITAHFGSTFCGQCSTAKSSIGKLLIPTDKCPDRKSARSSTRPHFEVCMSKFRFSVHGHYTALHCTTEHVSQGIHKLYHQQYQRVCVETRGTHKLLKECVNHAVFAPCFPAQCVQDTLHQTVPLCKITQSWKMLAVTRFSGGWQACSLLCVGFGSCRYGVLLVCLVRAVPFGRG